MKGKSKSSHDLLDDPKLSSVAAVEKTKELKKRKATDSDSSEVSQIQQPFAIQLMAFVQ